MKKFLVTLMTAAVVTATVIGCGAEAEQPAAQDTQQTVTDEKQPADDAAETEVGMVNPWKSTTEEESHTYLDHSIVVPEGATDVTWTVNDSIDGGALLQVDFTLDGQTYTVRAMTGQVEDMDTNLAGAYYEWTVTDEAALTAWDASATTYRHIGDAETVDVIAWYDGTTDISYSVYTAAPDLDGFDIAAIAEQIHN